MAVSQAAAADTALCSVGQVDAHTSTPQRLCCGKTRSVLHPGAQSSQGGQGQAGPSPQCKAGQHPAGLGGGAYPATGNHVKVDITA